MPTVTAPPRRADRAVERWIETFAGYLPRRRPLTVLDLGSGTGRFSPALAGAFGGPVYGVEPTRRARETAQRDAAHPDVTYLAGRADAIPLPDRCCDAALLFMSLHHIGRPDTAFAELARVTTATATLLVRCVFADRMPQPYWYRYFPTLPTGVGRGYASVAEVVALASAAGFAPVTLDEVAAEAPRTLRDLHAHVRDVLTALPGAAPVAEVSAGLAALARDAADHGDTLVFPAAADLLVLRR